MTPASAEGRVEASGVEAPRSEGPGEGLPASREPPVSQPAIIALPSQARRAGNRQEFVGSDRNYQKYFTEAAPQRCRERNPSEVIVKS